jgi:hypothetical protein
MFERSLRIRRSPLIVQQDPEENKGRRPGCEKEVAVLLLFTGAVKEEKERRERETTG